MFRPDPVTGENSVIIDFVDDITAPFEIRDYTNYGGTYDPDYNGYIFRFNRYLQDLVNTYIETGENNFDGFYFLLPSDFPITPSRAIINSEFSGGVEVSISYNKLN
ncbi:hypothetical protein GYB22_11570 [bacterium]|nr:hypothetical protein [bacterium]